MGNVTTTDLTAIDNSSTVTSINNNVQKLRDEFDKVVYKDGREELTGNLDANNKRIINLPDATTDTEPMTLRQLAAITEVVDGGLAAEVLLRTVGDAARPTSASLVADTGSSLVGFKQTGTGAATRTLQAKSREIVSVMDFGAVGDGVTDDSPAFQAALNTGLSVFVPPPVSTYLISSPVTTTASGQRIYGLNKHDTYLETPAASTNDIIRIANSHCEVDHLHFRPGSVNNKCIRVYAALCHIHNNRFLADTPNQGTAIYLDDINPVDSSVVAGAYIHTIENNSFGASGFEFEFGIFALSNTNGQQANKIINNQFLCDRPIVITRGGGNFYSGNLFQTSTGTTGTPVGSGIDLGVNVAGETIVGNYFEKYVNGVLSRRLTNDFVVVNISGNQNDNCTSLYTSLGSTTYIELNESLLRSIRNGWIEDFDNQDNFQFKNSSGLEIYNLNRVNRAFEPRLITHGSNGLEFLTFPSNGSTLAPTTSFAQITAGAPRTGCILGAGVRDGQHLYAFGRGQSVEILESTTARFNSSAANVTFGSSSGNIAMMHLIWSVDFGRWQEVSRAII